MSSPYTYTPAPDYISSLEFDYIETYSLQRGEIYEKEIKLLKTESDKLKVRKDKRSDFSIKEEQRLEELLSIIYTGYLIDKEGEFHFSAEKTNTYRKGNTQIEKLLEALNTPVNEVPMFLCAPEYRDAVVFYDASGKIVSVLNVCLSCAYMETEMFHHINGDYETYDHLKRFFIKAGHKVEEPNKFYMDMINKMKQKYSKSLAAETKK